MRELQESAESAESSYTIGTYTVLKAATVQSETVLWPWHLAGSQQATKSVFSSEDRYWCGWETVIMVAFHETKMWLMVYVIFSEATSSILLWTDFLENLPIYCQYLQFPVTDPFAMLTKILLCWRTVGYWRYGPNSVRTTFGCYCWDMVTSVIWFPLQFCLLP